MPQRPRTSTCLFLLLSVLLLVSAGTSSATEFFVAEEVQEGGVGGEHGHWLVKYGPIGTVIIRSRGGHPGLGARAKMAVARLNEALETWEHRDTDEAASHADRSHHLEFDVEPSARGLTIFFVPSHEETGEDHGAGHHDGAEHHDMEPVEIITVTAGDEIGYDRRSCGYVGRNAEVPGTDRNPWVSQELIAQWWIALLTDAFRVMAQNGEPVATRGVERAAVLGTLHERLAKGSGDLTATEKQSLEAVTFEVPAELSGCPPQDE